MLTSSEKTYKCLECLDTGVLQTVTTEDGQQYRVPSDMPNITIWLNYGQTAIASFEPCDCAKVAAERARMRRLMDGAEVPVKFQDCSFEAWDAGVSPAQKAGKLAARNYCELFETWDFTLQDATRQPHSHGIVLSGPSGVGKSGLIASTVNRRLRSGRSVLWIDFSKLIRKLRATYHLPRWEDLKDGEKMPPSYDQLIDAVVKAELVVIDDMGDKDASGITDALRQTVYDFMGERYNYMRPTLITTNLTPAKFGKMYGERISQRVKELYTWFELGEPMIRFQGIP
jgi:DNA replication protein DnaC